MTYSQILKKADVDRIYPIISCAVPDYFHQKKYRQILKIKSLKFVSDTEFFLLIFLLILLLEFLKNLSLFAEHNYTFIFIVNRIYFYICLLLYDRFENFKNKNLQYPFVYDLYSTILRYTFFNLNLKCTTMHIPLFFFTKIQSIIWKTISTISSNVNKINRTNKKKYFLDERNFRMIKPCFSFEHFLKFNKSIS